ncbi:MAG TPA: biotin-dependent carboxyltransferase family protein [Puia sp.]|jgi:antagonist of KipI|nr:biotin-dependent carboxyltransferase family protein [Puia sp.]
MSIVIIKPGLLDTIQDMGRYGHGNWGVNPGGAMDLFASQIANTLVGNPCTEAVIEIHFPGPQILFEQNAMIAITGADFSPMLNDEPIPLWKPVVMRKNTLLHFPKLKWGARCYVSVHGGFSVEKWLDSFSTNLKAAVGGLRGHPFQKGDEIPLRESTIYFPRFLKEEKNIRILPWQVNIKKVYRHLHEIFMVKGNEWDDLTQASRNNFLENNFIIHPSSDRMGYHLKGVTLELVRPLEMISSAVGFGTLQLLPAGQLIALMADHQTTGGFPRIGHVISAHLPKLAQLRPCDAIQFKIVGLEKAEELLLKQQQELKVLQHACLERLNALTC